MEEMLLKSKSMEVYQFILGDIIYCYQSIRRIKANQNEFDVIKTHDFFTRYRVQLKLTTSYNLKVNDNNERRYPPIIQALMKTYRNQPKLWPKLLLLLLWIDRTTYSLTIGYILMELILR